MTSFHFLGIKPFLEIGNLALRPDREPVQIAILVFQLSGPSTVPVGFHRHLVILGNDVDNPNLPPSKRRSFRALMNAWATARDVSVVVELVMTF
jgi:hypothetical protein